MPPTMVLPDHAVPPPKSTPAIKKYYKENPPIKIIVNWLKERMSEFGGRPAQSPADRILIVRAKTGSGKSTAMPVEIFRIFKPKNMTSYEGKSILCTQPRVLTTQEIPKDIASSDWATDMILGKTIGYSTGSGKMIGERGMKGILLYATIDTLLAQLRGDNSKDTIMNLYKMIILDEVHERSMTFDMTTMLMKQFIYENYKNPQCPFLILTSATFDTEKYCNYFGIKSNTNLIDVVGFVYPISEQFLKIDSDDTIQSAVELIKDIHEGKINQTKKEEGDILVFCYGMPPMKELKEKLLKYNVELIKNKKNPFVIALIEGKAVNYNTIERKIVYMDYDRLHINDSGEYDYKGKHLATRRIIAASNVAETGLTVPTLGHCIDLGWKNVKETYSPYGITGLVVKPVDKSNVMQRRGRVGRKFPGHFYAMYTEETFNSLTPIQLPDIVREDISGNVIDILIQQKNCFDVSKIDMLDVPSVDSLKMSIEKNIILGYVKSDYGKCFLMSELGEMVRELRYTTVEVFRCLISGYVYDICILDLVTIFAMSDVRLRKVNIEDILKEILPAFFFEKKEFMNLYTTLTMDDFITNLFIFKAFVSFLDKGISHAEAFCDKTKLNFNEMIEVIEKRLDIIDDLLNVNLDPYYLKEESIIKSTKDNYFDTICKIKKCLYDGFRLNIIQNNKITKNYNDRFGNNIKVNLPNHNLGFPKVVLTNKIKINSNPLSPNFQFNLETDKVSVLDGYIGIDTEFSTPIMFIETAQKKAQNDNTPLDSLIDYNFNLRKNTEYKLLFYDNEELMKFTQFQEYDQVY